MNEQISNINKTYIVRGYLHNFNKRYINLCKNVIQ